MNCWNIANQKESEDSDVPKDDDFEYNEAQSPWKTSFNIAILKMKNQVN